MVIQVEAPTLRIIKPPGAETGMMCLEDQTLDGLKIVWSVEKDQALQYSRALQKQFSGIEVASVDDLPRGIIR
jgi:hypothetical protein